VARLGVLISGGGTNLQAILDAIDRGEMDASVEIVISNKKDVYGLTRAENAHIPTFVSQDDDAILNKLQEYEVDYVLLLGYLRMISPEMVHAYPNRIINIHPSLIPAFCGKGYYGMKVHEAVIDKGVFFTGATVHFVNEIYDDGEIILQEVVPVAPDDTPQSIQKKVLKVEHEILVKAVNKVIEESKEDL